MPYLLFLIPLVVFSLAAMVVNTSAFRPPVIEEEPTDAQRVIFGSGKKRLVGYIWNESSARGLIVLAHGMGTSVLYQLPEIKHFADEGYKVFAFEYSGYGESSGHFYGFPQAVSDLKSAIAFMDDGTLPVVLLGHSMGGYAVCAVSQCLSRPVSAIVAYAPFYSSGEAIAEMTRGMPKWGPLLRLLILPVQYVLFGRRRRLNGVTGLRSANAPALILQGSRDDEVRCTGCSMYAHRGELTGSSVDFRLIEEADSSGHMTVIRKTGTHCLNADTMQLVDSFLTEIEKSKCTETEAFGSAGGKFMKML